MELFCGTCSPGRLVMSSRFPEVMTVPLASGSVRVRCCVGVSRLRRTGLSSQHVSFGVS